MIRECGRENVLPKRTSESLLIYSRHLVDFRISVLTFVAVNPYFVDNSEISTTDVPSGMVEVEAKAFGLNFREVMVALGELDEPLKGYECSGVITALGPNTEASGLKVGDRVCALVRGRLA